MESALDTGTDNAYCYSDGTYVQCGFNNNNCYSFNNGYVYCNGSSGGCLGVTTEGYAACLIY